MSNIIISIDGTAGSGKRRIAKYISKKYSFFHLDSGVLYRRLASIIIKQKINYNNIKILKQFLLNINYISPKSHKILRKEVVGNEASKIAKISRIRDFINMHQRNIVKKIKRPYLGCVIDGRDIGSKVFKNAKIKLFIQVNPEIRAKRRHKQLIEQGEKSIYSRILKEINLRDKTDINRKESPLVVPKGAIIIENSNSFKKTIEQINKALRKI